MLMTKEGEGGDAGLSEVFLVSYIVYIGRGGSVPILIGCSGISETSWIVKIHMPFQMFRLNGIFPDLPSEYDYWFAEY